ncbi:amino acid adenylation domain-containing protein [Actinacidiphila yanglinensis]|uniref:Amino acid adenylation domain-containing protein n=2 Tax=Actinacidiphila yanglinensis TaxID=310779 RepID=A0A1H6DH51_9ACTN|nr:amino acid adenylation domain-containing protein [Actinacidiphila yanglinensis]
MESGTPQYTIAWHLEWQGTRDPEVMAGAFRSVVRRHDALRTTFAEQDGVPFQVVANEPSEPMAVHDLRALSPAAFLERAASLRSDEAARPFDLACGPLIRASLLLGPDSRQELLLTAHHAVADAASMDIVVRELFADDQDALPPPRTQFAEYAARQRERLTPEALKTELAHWTALLAGAPTLLDVPTDRPRHEAASFRGARAHLGLDAATIASLRAFAADRNSTLFMALLAAVGVVVGRQAGEERLLIATPVGARHRPSLARTVGPMVNTVVIPVDLTGEPGFGTLLARVRSAVLQAIGRPELPFDQLVGHLNPQRHPGTAPLAQVMFTLAEAQSGESLPVTRRSTDTGYTRFDLTFAVDAAEPERATLEYRTELFDRERAARLAGQLRTILLAALAAPDRPVHRLPLLTPWQRAAMVNRENEIAPQESLCLHELIARQADRTPDAVAVVCGEQQVTYRALEGRATTLAGRLAACGVRPGDRVALLVDRRPDLIAAMLGVLKAGAAYVPLDPEYPDERIRLILHDCAAAHLLTTQALAARAAVTGAVPATCLDRPEVGPGTAAPSVTVDPGDPAYVTYTSGSTGTPKGAINTHRGVAAFALSAAEVYRLTPRDRWLQLAPLGFDVLSEEIYPALLAGGSVALPDGPAPWDPGELWPLVRRTGATALSTTPTALMSWAVDGVALVPPDLRRIIFGSEPAPSIRAFEAWREWPGELWHTYGLTETSCASSAYRVDTRAGTVGAQLSVPIGHRLARTRIHLLDRHMEPVPDGVVGELCVGGPMVGLGYWNRAHLTAERFVPDPFAPEPGSVLCRTGDQARRLPDGSLEFLGRLDDQIKLRGLRIEPGEVESALLAHPGLRQAVVVVDGGVRLVGYVVPVPGQTVDPAALRESAAKLLPAYMVPAAVVVLDRLPLTPNGKLDRQALPAARFGRSSPDGPRNEAEAVLAGIWAELLGLERVGVFDNFFDLGGHSLLATRMASRVRQTLGTGISVRDVFQRPTVALLAEGIGTRGTTRPGAGTTPDGGTAERRVPAPGRRPEHVPLSSAQMRLWLVQQMRPDLADYLIPTVLRVRGHLDVNALTSAVSTLVARHESLRTRFVAGPDGEPHQVVDPPRPVALDEHDLSAVGDAEQRRRTARTIVAAETSRPFDLARDPLLRVAVVRSAADDATVVVTVHHIAADGLSMDLLAAEFAAEYAAGSTGGHHGLAAPLLQPADLALAEREPAQVAARERQLGYWRRQLADLPELSLPTDRHRPAKPSGAGASLPVEVPSGTAARLRALGAGLNASLFMVTLAAFAVVLSRWSGQDDIVVGVPVAGRDLPGTDNVIGCFVNDLVMRVDLAEAPTFTDLVSRVRQMSLDAYAHQEVPFQRLVEELSPSRRHGRNPLFQVGFALQNAPDEPWSLPGLDVTPVPVDTTAVKFELSLILRGRRDGGLEGTFSFSTEVFDAATAAAMTAHLARVLRTVALRPDVPVGRIDLMAPGERHRLLSGLNATVRPFADHVPVNRLVEDQVARTPDAIAVVCGNHRLSYAGLDGRADRLARHIAAGGTGLGDLVAVHLDRGIDLIVAMLAIWKAGAAYVPLDLDHPAARLRFMLDDTRASLLLTTTDLSRTFPDAGVPVLAVDDLPSGPGPARRLPRPGPDDLAHVLYTSGSTGRPKGVVIQHRSIARIVHDAGYLRVRPGDRVVQASNVSFDAHTFECWATLTSGATLVILPTPTVLDPAEFAAALRRHAITVLYLTAGLFSQHLAANPSLAEGIRELGYGGEKVDRAAVDALVRRAVSPRTVRNMYGPTETTTFATSYEVVAPVARPELTTGPAGPAGNEASAPAERPTMPIGSPLPNTEVYVVDRAGEPVPTLVPGELLIGGPGVAAGYWRRPELTAERFLPNPFAPATAPGTSLRLYRTGDLVRWLPDGSLEFLGRLDGQVKLRGQRIEPGEVESALLAHPGVRQAVVVVDGEHLVGYVVPAPGHRLDAPQVRESTGTRLPGYMVPAAVVVLDRLPLTTNGKLDRQALPGPTFTGNAADGPRNRIEAVLAEVWAELLGVGQLGVHDNLFDLGGHSLHVPRLAAAIRRAFGVHLPLAAVFESPTVAGLARHVEQAPAAARDDAIRPSAAPDRAPLSRAQQGIWYDHRLRPDSAEYNSGSAYRLRGPLDAACLIGCLETLFDRHRSLRVVFRLENGVPTQQVRPPEEVAVATRDLSGLPAAEREQAVRRIVDAEAARPFDLSAAPPVRCCVLRLADDDHVLVLFVHHIVFDGWSGGVLLGELTALYGTRRRDEPDALPPLPIWYGDYVAWQREHTGEALDRQLAYWVEELRDAPARLALPQPNAADPAAAAAPTGTRRLFTLPLATTERLEQLSREEGVTLFVTLLSALGIVLHRYTRQDNIVVGVPVADRTRPETQGLVGLFLNVLALRLRLDGGPTVRELLGRVLRTVSGGLAHQDVPFADVVSALRRDGGNPAAASVGQVLFTFAHTAPVPDAQPPEFVLEPLVAHRDSAPADMVVAFWRTATGLSAEVSVAHTLLDPGGAARLAERLRLLLDALAARPNERVTDLDLATDEERMAALRWSVSTPSPFDAPDSPDR